MEYCKISNNTLSSKECTLQITFPIYMFDLAFFFLAFPHGIKHVKMWF